MAGSYQYNVASVPSTSHHHYHYQTIARGEVASTAVNLPQRHNPFLVENLPDLLVPAAPSMGSASLSSSLQPQPEPSQQ